MINYFFGFILLFIFASCGLNYTPPPTIENAGSKRKMYAENYLKEQFKDSAVTFQTVLFGETTVVKPESYKFLDSLFELKYSNELRNIYDSKLETQIGNQQQIVVRDTAKVYYIEHLVYAIDDKRTAEVSFSEITMNKDGVVSNFRISEQVTFSSRLLPLYKTYLTEESISHPGYLPTNEERLFYTTYKNQYNALRLSEKSTFLEHTLMLMELVSKIKTLNKELMIRAISVSKIFGRPYDPSQDNFTAIDGVLIENELTEYIAEFSSNDKSYTIRFTPFLEIIGIQSN